MEKFTGKSVCGGVAFGKVRIFRRNGQKVKRRRVEDTEAETARYTAARDKAMHELELLFYKANKEIGEAEAQIFSIHRMMLEDIDYNESVENIIKKQGINAEAAVLMTADSFSKMFAEMDDAYMQARAGDVRDVSDRVINILCGTDENKLDASEDSIIFADDLAPSETLQMDKSKITAFVTERGSPTSHTAILARSMNIPAVIGVKISEEYDGKSAAVDGASGTVYIEPDEKTLAILHEKKAQREEMTRLLKQMKDKPTVTLDGKTIKLYANIGTPSDLGNVLLNDAEGIGLFRSEFLYLESKDFPDEGVQFEAYKKVCEGMGEKPVIIRTLDIGADKKIDYFNLPDEENPAMGMRAIRICLTRRDIFKTQLRAILHASAFGNIMIMLPMIVSAWEIDEAKKVLDEAKAELAAEGIPFAAKIPVGIMIETPAAAVISDELAHHADFFSIGTNDLTQYTLAMDRQNDSIADFTDVHHESVLRLIKITAENAHKNGIWVGICGELGADTELIPKFLEMGIDELSVSPNRVLEVRKTVRESHAKEEK